MGYVVQAPAIVGVPVHGSSDLFPVRRIFCVGRNYAAHAREMGHDPDREPPFFFTKPADAIVLCLDPKLAPNTVNNFVFLARNQFYDGLKFHRVEANFVIQGGDPKGDGTGGPGYQFKDEQVTGEYTTGAVAMANSGPNTNGSQFFICTVDDTKKLQKLYNLFGYVQRGMDVVLKIAAGDVMTSVTVQEETG